VVKAGLGIITAAGVVAEIVKDSSQRAVMLVKVIKILRFITTIDDPELVRSSLEQVIEMLDEEMNRK